MTTTSAAPSLRAMARALLDDPEVYVGAWAERDKGVGDGDVAAAEAALGAPLPPGLAALYREMDGFGITWVSRKDWGGSALRLKGMSFDKARSKRDAKPSKGLTQFDKGFATVWVLDGAVTGHVYFPPLKELVKSPYWTKFVRDVKKSTKGLTLEVDGETLPVPELYERLRLLDLYAATEHAFLYLNGSAPPGVLQLINSNEYDGSKIVPFDDYLRHVVETRGEIQARARLFRK